MEQMKTPYKRNFPRTKQAIDDKDEHFLCCEDCDFYYGYPCGYGGICDLSGRELPPNDGCVCKHFNRQEGFAWHI